MKTVREWLEELPEPWRSSALRQADPDCVDYEALSMGCALDDFTCWQQTDEGHWPWKELLNYYQYGTPMPKHPSEEAQ